MDDDEVDSDLLARGLERVRIARLRWVILIGMCVVVAVLFGMAGAGLWHWWPFRVWMIPALLIAVVFVLLALFSLKAPKSVRKRLWVRRGILIVPPLLTFPLVAWGASDLVGSGGLYGGIGAGIGIAVLNIMRGWPRDE